MKLEQLLFFVFVLKLLYKQNYLNFVYFIMYNSKYKFL